MGKYAKNLRKKAALSGKTALSFVSGTPGDQ